ncbi:L,D-transpeptidase family protein [Candidatus Methylobacter favarea]|nr:L,D-transpeptidase family protein [Candidatus Methylobacter favarea]
MLIIIKKLSFQPANDWKILLKRYAGWSLMFLFLNLSMQPLFGEGSSLEVSGIDQEITAIIAARQHPYLMLSSFQNRAEDMDNLYKMADYRLLWLGNGHSEKNIADVLHLLANASVHGLNPVHYDTETLRQKLIPALSLKPEAYKELALYDTAISISLLRYAHDLHYGRVNPQGINFKLKLREKKLTDLASLIKANLDAGALLQLPELVEPNFKQYRKLKEALVTYKQLAEKSPLFEMKINKPVRSGDHHPKIAELRRFLVAVGDLPQENAVGDLPPEYPESPSDKFPVYTEEIAAGVKKFQYRHGLTPDGVIGKGTAEALSVPLKERVTQIELAMERLRWLPELSVGASIIVNIPAFQLWAFDDAPAGAKAADIVNMKVVVGRALKNQTPVLMAEMRFIDFMPYWNIPYSITKKEILPKLIQNNNYLATENMELVSRFGNEALPVPVTETSIAQLKQGLLKVRQRPGLKNALGRVKFIFPNENDVYLHDTPANSLFSKSRRDFSHGCVRVEDPKKLADFVLKNQEGWTREAVEQAMKTPKTQRVVLKKSIPVLFFYTTSFFDQNNNLVFYPDIYGHDAVLLGALKKPEDVSDHSLFISKNSSPVELGK